LGFCLFIEKRLIFWRELLYSFCGNLFKASRAVRGIYKKFRSVRKEVSAFSTPFELTGMGRILLAVEGYLSSKKSMFPHFIFPLVFSATFFAPACQPRLKTLVRVEELSGGGKVLMTSGTLFSFSDCFGFHIIPF